MNRIRQVFIFSYLISGGCLVLGFLLADLWWAALVIVAYRLLLWFGSYWNKNWFTSVVFILDFVIIIVGIPLRVSVIVLLVGLLGSLIMWDTAGSYYRYKDIEFYNDEITHAHRHIKRLMVTVAVGGVLAFISLAVTLKPGFGTMVIFSLLSVLGIVIGIQLARRSI